MHEADSKRNSKRVQGGRTQSTALDTLLELIETASGTNGLWDRVCAMAGEREGKEERRRSKSK